MLLPPFLRWNARAQPQEEHFKDVLLAAELKSEHPLAGAIVAVLQDEEKITPAPLSSFESITGKGIKVSYQGKTYWVGSHKLLKDFLSMQVFPL